MKQRWFFFGLMIGSVLFFPAWMWGGETDPPLPDGPNRAVVKETCTPCHSAAIIAQNRMSRKRWDETITWMQNQQGLETLTPQVRKEILDYLETVQGLASPQSQPRPRGNPMYEYDYPPNPL